MTVLALCVIRGNSNFTQYRLSTLKLRNAFSTVSKYNGTSIISFGILGKTCFIASPIFFILAINSHFLLALISQFHVLHFCAFLLLLDFVSLLLFVLVLAQSFSSQFLYLLAFLLLLSLESLYLSFLLLLLRVLLLLFLSPLLSLDRILLLLSLSRHYLLLLSPCPHSYAHLVPR